MESETRQRLRRVLWQRCDDLYRAGVTHLAKQASPRHPTSEDDSTQVIHEVAAAPESGVCGPAGPERNHPAGGPVVTKSLFADVEGDPGQTDREGALCSVSLTLEERESRLLALAQCVAACTRCQELAQSRTQTVFGVGHPQARLMLIGEAPGADEDRLGEPFVGRAGQLLDRIIDACNFKRQELYICNILRCRPPGNRTPTSTEAANCREYLDGQIAIIDPEFIVCLGTVAAQNLLDTTTSIGRLRGKFASHGRARVLCTYHPSYLLRNPAAKKDVWNDMLLLLDAMGLEPKKR